MSFEKCLFIKYFILKLPNESSTNYFHFLFPGEGYASHQRQLRGTEFFLPERGRSEKADHGVRLVDQRADLTSRETNRGVRTQNVRVRRHLPRRRYSGQNMWNIFRKFEKRRNILIFISEMF